jgi:hypothetical protein
MQDLTPEEIKHLKIMVRRDLDPPWWLILLLALGGAATLVGIISTIIVISHLEVFHLSTSA